MKRRNSAPLQQLSRNQQAAGSPLLDNLHGLYKQGRFKEGLALAEEAGPKLNKNADLLDVAGMCAMACDAAQQAETFWRQALTLKPNDANTHFRLAELFEKKKRIAEAEAGYRKAASLKPQFAEAHFKLGEMLNRLNRLDDAEASFRHAITLKPVYDQAEVSLSILLIGRWRFREGFGRLWRVLSKHRKLAKEK